MVTSLFGMFGSAVALLFGGWDIALRKRKIASTLTFLGGCFAATNI